MFNTYAAIDIPLRVKAGGIPSGGSFRCDSLTEQPVSANLAGCSRAVAGGTAGSAKPPVLLFSIVFGLPELFVPHGSPAEFTGLGATCWADSSPALHWFIIGTNCSPDWFRILWFENRRCSSSRESKILERSHCLGWTGRLRRTDLNPLYSDRFGSIESTDGVGVSRQND